MSSYKEESLKTIGGLGLQRSGQSSDQHGEALDSTPSTTKTEGGGC